MNVERRGSIKQSVGQAQLGSSQEEVKPQTKPFIINRWQVYEAFRRICLPSCKVSIGVLPQHIFS